MGDLWRDVLFVGATRCNLETRSVLEHMSTYVRPGSDAGIRELVRSANTTVEEVDRLVGLNDALLEIADFVDDDLLVSTHDSRQASALLRQSAHDCGLRFRRRMWLDLTCLSTQFFGRKLALLRMAAVFGFLPVDCPPERVKEDQQLRLAAQAVIRLHGLLSLHANPLKNLYLGGFPAIRESLGQ